MMKTTKVIPISPRTEGMVDASAKYYQESRIFHAIQNTQALEYDQIDERNIDLALQLSPLTATWGLVYWEIAVGLIPRPLDDYERRRPPILARLINEENFGAEMIYKIAEGFGANIRINIDSAACLVDVTFLQGVPSFLEEFNDALQNIIHAHLGVGYFFEYHMDGGLQIETSYRRYMYRLPVACSTLLCGALPTVVTLGRLYPATISMDTESRARQNEYKKTGLYASGPRPFVAVDGRIYPATVGSEISIRHREQPYTVSGTAESGTLPTKAVDGRLYSADTNANTDNHSATITYKLCNKFYSGGEPKHDNDERT